MGVKGWVWPSGVEGWVWTGLQVSIGLGLVRVRDMECRGSDWVAGGIASKKGSSDFSAPSSQSIREVKIDIHHTIRPFKSTHGTKVD